MNPLPTLIFLVLLCLAGPVIGQHEGTAFSATGRGGVSTTFATDYQTVGVNPANLGFHKSFRDPTVTFGFFEINATFFSEGLTRSDVKNAIFARGNQPFSYQEKARAADKMANTSWSVNTDMMLAGGSVRLKGGHGLAFSLRDRINVFGRINRNAAEIAFLGSAAAYFPQLILSDGRVIDNPRFPGNESQTPLTQQQFEKVVNGLYPVNDSAKFYSEFLDGSRISSSWFREINLAYGKKVLDTYDLSIHVGGGVRYIQGLMLIELAASNGELTASNISVSEAFGLYFGDSAAVTNPTFRPPMGGSRLSRLAFPNPVGHGFGLDLGVTFVVKNNLYIGVALTNIGRITWDGNVYQVTDGRLIQFAGSGLNSYNLLNSEPGAFQFAGDKSPLKWEGSNSIVQELPSMLRFGMSYEFFRTFHIGFDIIAPQNKVAGNLDGILYALGGDFRPSKVFKVSAGLNFGGNNQSKVNIPVGVSYLARKGFYEAGLATRDISTYLANFGGGSTLSFATGFLRFRI
jgi:hypothetical protein